MIWTFERDGASQRCEVRRDLDGQYYGFVVTVPDGSEQVERAMRLVPLKLAHESRAYARALGWPHPHTRLTTRLLELAQRRSRDGYLTTWLSDLLAP